MPAWMPSYLPYPQTAIVTAIVTPTIIPKSTAPGRICRLVDTLDRHNLTSDTLIVFVSDQGYSLGSHGFVGKQTMYEEGILTPLILRYPRIARGKPTNDALVSLIDLFPTICRSAGIEVPESVEGKSLLGLYQGEQASIREEVFASFHSPTSHYMVTRCIRTRRHKLIHHLLTDEVELFDLAGDPHELENLAGHPESAALQDRLIERLLSWREGTEDK